jgi:hypothetical protein
MKKVRILFLALLAVAVIGVAATVMRPHPQVLIPCGGGGGRWVGPAADSVIAVRPPAPVGPPTTPAEPRAATAGAPTAAVEPPAATVQQRWSC